MEKYRNEVHEYFSQMSREELKNLLEEVGVKVEDGDGRIVFTGDTDLLDRFTEIDQLHSMLLYKVDNVAQTYKELADIQLKENILYKERDSYNKHLNQKREEIEELLRNKLDEDKLTVLFKSRYNTLDKQILHFNLDNNGTTVNILENFHHDLSIDIQRCIVSE